MRDSDIEKQAFVILKLCAADIESIYPLMKKDFPPNELKQQKMIEDSFKTGFMEGYGLYRTYEAVQDRECIGVMNGVEKADRPENTDGTENTDTTGNRQLLAYAILVKIDRVLLLDYLAVAERFREQGVGSIFLQELKDMLKGYECVIVEVENPDYCDDPEEKSLMQRRIKFYERNGVRDTGASCRVYGVEFRLIEMDFRSNVGAHHSDETPEENVGTRHSAEEAMERISRFYHTYWPEPETYAKYVQMHEC